METFIVILVLIILFVLLGGTAWFFGKEAGPGAGTAWLTGTRQFRSMVSPFSSKAVGLRQPSSAVMLDDSRLHELADELRGELERTANLAQEFENRLLLVERELGQTKRLPQALDARVQSAESDARARLARLRQEMQQARKADSPYNVRRNDAVSKLYQKLAQLEVALGAVVNPMLLPGEPISVPENLYEDTLVWDNWGDVADRAYAFGEQFSQHRFLLEPALADRVERFICEFREALTGTVYPIVQDGSATAQQRSDMRAGIISVVEGITPLRREFEHTWMQGTNIEIHHEEEDNDFPA